MPTVNILRHALRNARRALGSLGLAALTLGAAACGGDDDPAAPSGDLTAAEAEAMMEALVSAGGAFFFAPPVSFGAPALQPTSEDFDETIPCPGGGNVRLTGTVSSDMDNDGNGTLSMNVTQVHDGCTATAQSNGSTWTFDGDPSVQVAFEWVLSETAISVSGTQSGSIAYSSGGKSGSCATQLSYDFSVGNDGQTVSGTVNGSVCGIDVSDSFAGL